MTNSSKSRSLPWPVRSISLPSRLHPTGLTVEAELSKLRNFETSSHCTETIQADILGLVELYSCVQELMQCPNTQKALLEYQHGALFEEALEGSLELLDSCATVRNLFCSIKEQVQHVQSALRRKGADSSIGNDISNYFIFRKKVKKEIVINLRRLKRMENRIESSLFLDIEQSLSMVIRVLKDVMKMTISIFKVLLVFLSCQDSKMKNRGWSMISKLMITKSAPSQGAQIFSDMGNVDITLGSLRENITINDVNNARRRLQTLDAIIDSFEAGLESLYKQLIQSRVSFLNVLAH